MSTPGHSRDQQAGVRRRKRATWVVSCSVLASLAVTTPAQAAPPVNDDWQDATAVTTVPFADTTDTSEATKDSPPMPFRCWNARGHSVWYRIELSTSRTVVVTTAGSDYNTVLNLYRAEAGESPEQWALRRCDNNSGPGPTSAVSFEAKAGVAYYAMASGRRKEHSGELKFEVRQPIELVDARIGRRGRADLVDGSATLHGRVECSRAGRARVTLILRQRVGENVAEGRAARWIDCTRSTKRFRMSVYSHSGFAFDPGRARMSRVRISACEPTICTEVFQVSRRIVRLR